MKKKLLAKIIKESKYFTLVPALSTGIDESNYIGYSCITEFSGIFGTILPSTGVWYPYQYHLEVVAIRSAQVWDGLTVNIEYPFDMSTPIAGAITRLDTNRRVEFNEIWGSSLTQYLRLANTEEGIRRYFTQSDIGKPIEILLEIAW